MDIESDKNYEIRLMPDMHNLPDSILELRYTNKNADYLVSKYFSYILSDNKLDFIVFGYSIQKYIQMCMKGFYGTNEGYFILEHGEYDDSDNEIIPQFYFSNKDKSIISVDEKYGNEADFTKHNDVVFYKPFILFSVKEKYKLVFKTRKTSGFLEFYNIGIKEGDSIYKEGDDKNKITSLYDSADTLGSIVEKYKLGLFGDNPDLVFDNPEKFYASNKK